MYTLYYGGNCLWFFFSNHDGILLSQPTNNCRHRDRQLMAEQGQRPACMPTCLHACVRACAHMHARSGSLVTLRANTGVRHSPTTPRGRLSVSIPHILLRATHRPTVYSTQEKRREDTRQDGFLKQNGGACKNAERQQGGCQQPPSDVSARGKISTRSSQSHHLRWVRPPCFVGNRLSEIHP